VKPRVWTEIDLAAIAHNLKQIRRRLPAETEILTVVKADAYGHGAVEVGRCVLQHGASMLGVGDSCEALQLREAGITAPILVLGALVPGEIEPVIAADVTVCIHSSQKARLLDQMSRTLRKPLRVHVKIDTGMGRLGVLPERALPLVEEIGGYPNLQLEGICTHLASTRAEDPFVEEQMDRFETTLSDIQRAGVSVRYRHAANSLGCFFYPRTVFNLLRPGIAAYGLIGRASAGRGIELRPALSLKTQVIFIKDLPADSPVGYAGTFRTQRPTRIAILPVGYNDGYSFHFSNRAQVLVKGRRVPVIGRVSMDYTTADVTDIPGVQVGEEVVLIGRQGEESISVEELAKIKETIPYEITCALGKRVRRIYRSDDAKTS
jgi:alanine racemase